MIPMVTTRRPKTQMKEEDRAMRQVQEIQALIVELERDSKRQNTNKRNSKITLDARGAQILKAKERQVLVKMYKVSATVVGAAVLGALLVANPGYGKVLRSVWSQTARLLPDFKPALSRMATAVAKRVPQFYTTAKSLVDERAGKALDQNPNPKSRVRQALLKMGLYIPLFLSMTLQPVAPYALRAGVRVGVRAGAVYAGWAAGRAAGRAIRTT